ncbi:transcriptional regulator [Bacteroidia bacterium]|nr:transcriptional regulator [Bacteroidia bacterium]
MPTINYEEISQLALDFRNQCFLNAYDAIDCEKLLLKLNVLTVFRPLSGAFSGMCERKRNRYFMLINSEQVLARQHFTIAHELYHLFVQQEFKVYLCNPGVQTKDVEETKADVFAANFLLPELGIKQMIPIAELKTGITLPTLFKLESYFSVSHAALLNRLKDLKLLTNREKEAYSTISVIQLAKTYGFDTKLYEKGNNENLVIGDYAVLAREKFEQDKISEGHYIELLNAIGIHLPAYNNEENQNSY